MSIRFKLGLVLSLAMVAATGCGSLAFLSLRYASLRESQEQRISLWKANIANIASESLLARDPLMLYDYLQGIRRSYKEILRLCVETNGVCQEVGGQGARLIRVAAMTPDSRNNSVIPRGYNRFKVFPW